MANTNFTGPVISTNGFIGAVTGNTTGNVTGGIDARTGYVILYSTTAAAIADITDAVNTSDKEVGTIVFDTTNSKLKIATGDAAADTWVDADGTNAVTPS
jgi:hypothetical protein